MKKNLVSAASAAALLAFGLTACAQEQNRYAETEESANRTAYAEIGDEPLPGEYTRMGDEAALAGDRLAQANETSPNAGGVTTDPTTAYAASEPVTVEIAEVRVKDEVEAAAENAFMVADLNGDGVLSRDEYMTIAMNLRPQTTADATTMPAPDGALEEGDTTMLAEEPSPVTVAAAFEAAAGPDGELTREKLREAFLARFEQADADGDDELNDEEWQTFAALTTGEAREEPRN